MKYQRFSHQEGARGFQLIESSFEPDDELRMELAKLSSPETRGILTGDAIRVCGLGDGQVAVLSYSPAETDRAGGVSSFVSVHDESELPVDPIAVSRERERLGSEADELLSESVDGGFERAKWIQQVADLEEGEVDSLLSGVMDAFSGRDVSWYTSAEAGEGLCLALSLLPVTAWSKVDLTTSEIPGRSSTVEGRLRIESGGVGRTVHVEQGQAHSRTLRQMEGLLRSRPDVLSACIEKLDRERVPVTVQSVGAWVMGLALSEGFDGSDYVNSDDLRELAGTDGVSSELKTAAFSGVLLPVLKKKVSVGLGELRGFLEDHFPLRGGGTSSGSSHLSGHGAEGAGGLFLDAFSRVATALEEDFEAACSEGLSLEDQADVLYLTDWFHRAVYTEGQRELQRFFKLMKRSLSGLTLRDLERDDLLAWKAAVFRYLGGGGACRLIASLEACACVSRGRKDEILPSSRLKEVQKAIRDGFDPESDDGGRLLCKGQDDEEQYTEHFLGVYEVLTQVGTQSQRVDFITKEREAFRWYPKLWARLAVLVASDDEATPELGALAEKINHQDKWDLKEFQEVGHLLRAHDKLRSFVLDALLTEKGREAELRVLRFIAGTLDGDSAESMRAICVASEKKWEQRANRRIKPLKLAAIVIVAINALGLLGVLAVKMWPGLTEPPSAEAGSPEEDGTRVDEARGQEDQSEETGMDPTANNVPASQVEDGKEQVLEESRGGLPQNQGPEDKEKLETNAGNSSDSESPAEVDGGEGGAEPGSISPPQSKLSEELIEVNGEAGGVGADAGATSKSDQDVETLDPGSSSQGQ